MSGAASIRELVARELAQPVEPAALTLAAAARARLGNVQAVLFYGSCLRDGLSPDAVADVYLLTEDYRHSGQSWLAATANRVLPPNVVYLEADAAAGRLRAKAAIVALDHFGELVGPKAFHSYFWARFAQPAALVWSADRGVDRRVQSAMVRAISTFAAETTATPLAAGGSSDFWIDGFRKTYASELRAEGPERARHIYEADRARYDAVFDGLLGTALIPAGAACRWRRRRLLGKALSVARLAKGVFTFDGGLDYILWKIRRHTGVAVTPRPWERSVPVFGQAWLAFRVWRLGGFR